MKNTFYQVWIFAAALVVQAVVIFLAVVVYDFNDRQYPTALGAVSAFTLDFSESGLRDDEAKALVAEVSAGLKAGLVKELPDTTDPSSRLYAPVDDARIPDRVDGFGLGAGGALADASRLDASPASGTYLITGSLDSADAVDARLTEAGVSVVRQDKALVPGLAFLLLEGSFLTPILVVALLLVSTAVLWTAVTARARMLRLLAGASPVSIHLSDLCRYLIPLLAATALGLVVGIGGVGVLEGGEYVSGFAILLLVLSAIAVTGGVLALLLLSLIFRPDVDAFARRKAPVGKLRMATRLVQATAFGLLVAIGGFAWAGIQTSAAEADRASVWNQLSSVTSLEIAMDETDMIAASSASKSTAEHADRRSELLYSAVTTEEEWGGDFAGYEAIAFVNETWLDTVTAEPNTMALQEVAPEAVSEMLMREWAPTLDLLADGTGTTAQQLLAEATFAHAPENTPIAVQRAGSGSTMTFAENTLVVTLPPVASAFNAETIVSLFSTGNLTFTDMDAAFNAMSAGGLTGDALADENITGSIRPVYAAEDGVLSAQLARYTAMLSSVAFAVILATFLVSSAANGLIAALLHLRRDGPLRLAGRSWLTIVGNRAAADVLIGVLIAVVCIGLISPRALIVSAIFVLVGTLSVMVSQMTAAGRCFTLVMTRRL